MKKYILLTLTLLFISIFTVSSFAINMNLSEDESSTESDDVEIIEAIVEGQTSSDESLEEIFENESNNDENIVEDINTDNQPTSTVTGDSTNENFFTAENIINVILIAVGIVLIFLGIAILIRLK